MQYEREMPWLGLKTAVEERLNAERNNHIAVAPKR